MKLKNIALTVLTLEVLGFISAGLKNDFKENLENMPIIYKIIKADSEYKAKKESLSKAYQVQKDSIKMYGACPE
jgi:hypothetical protein